MFIYLLSFCFLCLAITFSAKHHVILAYEGGNQWRAQSRARPLRFLRISYFYCVKQYSNLIFSVRHFNITNDICQQLFSSFHCVEKKLHNCTIMEVSASLSGIKALNNLNSAVFLFKAAWCNDVILLLNLWAEMSQSDSLTAFDRWISVQLKGCSLFHNIFLRFT